MDANDDSLFFECTITPSASPAPPCACLYKLVQLRGFHQPSCADSSGVSPYTADSQQLPAGTCVQAPSRAPPCCTAGERKLSALTSAHASDNGLRLALETAFLFILDPQWMQESLDQGPQAGYLSFVFLKASACLQLTISLPVGENGLRSALETAFLFIQEPQWTQEGLDRAKQRWVASHRGNHLSLEKGTTERIFRAMFAHER